MADNFGFKIGVEGEIVETCQCRPRGRIEPRPSLDPAADMGAKRGRKLGQALHAGCMQHHTPIFGIADHNLGPGGLQCDDKCLGSHARMQAG